MLPVALLLVAATPATTDVSAGVDVGATFASSPVVLAHAGVFGRFRLDALVVRTDISADFEVGPHALVMADMTAQWAHDITDDLVVAVGGGPTIGLVFRPPPLDSRGVGPFERAVGLVALATLDYDVGEHLAFFVDARALVAGFVVAAGVTVDGGVAYRF